MPDSRTGYSGFHGSESGGTINYEQTTDALTERIVALGDRILGLSSPWDLLHIPDFKSTDLAPSLAQASFALSKAQAILRASRQVSPSKEHA